AADQTSAGSRYVNHHGKAARHENSGLRLFVWESSGAARTGICALRLGGKAAAAKKTAMAGRRYMKHLCQPFGARAARSRCSPRTLPPILLRYVSGAKDEKRGNYETLSRESFAGRSALSNAITYERGVLLRRDDH